jgi:ribose transport system ATP-binding protein
MNAATAPAPAAPPGASMLEFHNVVKRFGGTVALKGVSLKVNAGEIVALVGENGAGKSTLIKALAGIDIPEEGEILYRGVPYRHRPPRYGEHQPVAFIHQDLGLVEWMTIAENMALALGYPRRHGRIDWPAADAAAARALRRVNCDVHPGRRVNELSRTEKSLVAIARALAVDCDLLVLDEPTASLPVDEVERLFDALRPLKALGVGMIYVSHRLDEVFAIADRVAVLRDGRLVGTSAVADTSAAQLVEMIVGRIPETTNPAAFTGGAERLRVQNLATDGIGPVSFTVVAGEIVGLVGLRGAGQESVGRALFGAMECSGEVRLDGVTVALTSPQAAIAAGIGLIARDRNDESLLTGLTIRENMFANPGALGRALLAPLPPGREARAAQALGELVDLRPNDPSLGIEALSGGNQQKVVVGRWLHIGGRLLIAEDPTAGVDVGAKIEIYRLIEKARQAGLAVLVVSTDFEEVTRICNRALIFSRGHIVAELAGSDIVIPAILHAASAKPVNAP